VLFGFAEHAERAGEIATFTLHDTQQLVQQFVIAVLLGHQPQFGTHQRAVITQQHLLIGIQQPVKPLSADERREGLRQPL